MKILHITHHEGCKKSLDFVASKLGISIETQYADWNYNVGHERASELWEKYKDYYNSFDLIITSDTAPLSRILLQNNFQGRLIIWVCTRFDYTDEATNDCGFPDEEFHELIRKAYHQKNVKIYSYTKFEYEYARKYRNVDFGEKVIKPCCQVEKENNFVSELPSDINRAETFFIPPYHNDTVCVNLQEKCNELRIPAYNGRYNGPADLAGIKGIIHIPYAWSNLALFENWCLGNVYLIPTARYLFQLQTEGHFFWSPPFPPAYVSSAEWYCREHRDLFIYFDNWRELKEAANNTHLLNTKKQQIVEFNKDHNRKIIEQWKQAIMEW